MRKRRTTGLAKQSTPHTDEAVAHREYVRDVLRKVRTASTHNKVLRAGSADRIRKATEAIKAAGLQEGKGEDPLKVYHAVQRMLEETAFYPPHDKRKESPAYAKVHNQMTVAEDQPCLVCRVRHSSLRDPQQNPFGAIQMETHHHTIEWALANAIEPALFNKFVRPGLRKRAAQRQAAGDTDPIYQEFDPLYADDMTGAQIKAWIDHSPDNLWVLCDVHHRHKFVGIHAITYPIWGPQDLVNQTIVQMEIATATGGAAKGGKKAAKKAGRKLGKRAGKKT